MAGVVDTGHLADGRDAAPGMRDGQLQRLLETTHEAFIAIDETGAITDWNAAAEASFGWTAGEAIGHELADLLIPEQLRAAHRRGLARFLATGQGPLMNRRFEIEALHKDGRRVPVEITIAPIQTADGHVFAAFLRDLSDRRRIEHYALVHQAVNDALMATGPLEESSARLLERVGAGLDWHVGCLWLTDERTGALHCTALWHDPSVAVEAFSELTREMVVEDAATFAQDAWRGESHATALTETVDDVALSRSRLAAQAGLKAAVAVPLLGSREVLGVLEFFAAGRRSLEPVLLDLIGAVAAQFAQFVERKRIDQKVQSLSERNTRILNAVGDGIYGVDALGRATFANPAAAQILGHDQEELVGQPISELLAEGDPKEIGRLVDTALRTGEPLHVDDAVFRRRSGELFPAQYTVTPLATPGGPSGAVVTFRDVSDRRRAEQQLAREREFLQAVLDSMQDGVIACDANGTLTLINRSTREMYGATSEPRPPERWAQTVDVYRPDGTPMPVEELPLARALRGEVVRDAKLVLVPNAGGEHQLLVSGQQMLDAEGRTLGAVVVMHDVTERAHAEELVRESERRLAQAQEIARVGSWELDIETGELSWSRELYRIFGVSPDSFEPTYDAFMRMIEKEDRTAIRKAQDDLILADVPFDLQCRLAGSGRVVHALADVTRDASGRARKLRGTVQDVTEQQNAEEALRRSEQRVRQAERLESVGQLAGGIAHDFNNLLGVILNYADFVAEELADRPALRSDVDEMRKAAERAASMTRRLLIFSRREIAQRELLDLNEVISDVEQLLRRTIGEDIELVAELSPQLRPVLGDPGQLEQVLVNLAVNARDAMPRGGRLTISTSNVEREAEGPDLPAGSYVRLLVADTGEGMGEKVLGRIFEPFFTTKPKGRGTGLGLATVYGIVREAGGAISVDSDPGAGARFEVLLPASSAQLPESDDDDDAALPLAGDGAVLLVEDEPAVAEVARRVLCRGGYSVLHAADGGAALEWLRDSRVRVDILVTDLVMPGMSGAELADEALMLRPGLAVVYTSGYPLDVVSSHGLSVGETHFVDKPFTADELLRCVRKARADGAQSKQVM
jgi:two-component system cell cycle sensor histidine kinase/response regulator CckA